MRSDTNSQRIEYLDRLGDAIHTAVVRDQARRSRNRWRLGKASDVSASRTGVRTQRFVATATVLVAIGVAVGALLLLPVGQAEAVSVEYGEEFITITLLDLEANPEKVLAEIEESGAPVALVDVAASPSLVGRFVGMGVSGADGTQIARLNEAGDGIAFTGLRIPLAFSGRVELQLGREAQTAEPYAVAGSAYADGELLACSGVFGQEVGDAVRVLEELSIKAAWQIQDSSGNMTQADPATISVGYYATDAIPVSSSHVLIYANTEPESLLATPPNVSPAPCK